MRVIVPVVVFAESLDDSLLLQETQDGAVLLVGAVADVQGVRLTQVHAVLDELPQGRAQRRQISLQDASAGLVLRLQLRRHGADEAFTAVKTQRSRGATREPTATTNTRSASWCDSTMKNTVFTHATKYNSKHEI